MSSPLLPGGARELDIPTNHADLIPTLLGLAGVDQDQALARLKADHVDAHALVGRDLSDAIHAADPAAPSEPIPFTTDDEISEGSMKPASPFRRAHLVKFSRYYDNPRFWTVPGERDERPQGRKTVTVTEPEPDEWELYDLTLDPTEPSAGERPGYRPPANA